jgi:hypothetical protein
MAISSFGNWNSSLVDDARSDKALLSMRDTPEAGSDVTIQTYRAQDFGVAIVID